MLNGVSSVSFQAGVFDKPNFTAPQTYVRPEGAPADSSGKKKGKAGKVILGIALAAAAVAGLIIGHNKNAFKNVGKIIPEGIKNAKWLQWAKQPAKAVMNAFDVAGGWLKNVPTMVAGWFGKGAAKA